MIPLEEARLYLPKYLSPESERQLFDELRAFPQNVDDRLYTYALRDQQTLFQGDGVEDLLVVKLPDPQIRPLPCMVLSNTCDVDPANPRPYPTALCYAPLIKLSRYRELLARRELLPTEQAIDDHISTIRRQRITQVFFLPKGGRLEDDALVFLDRICHCSPTVIDRATLPQKRLFTLSNYGAWLFLLKLSIHFTRLTDKVDRS